MRKKIKKILKTNSKSVSVNLKTFKSLGLLSKSGDCAVGAFAEN